MVHRIKHHKYIPTSLAEQDSALHLAHHLCVAKMCTTEISRHYEFLFYANLLPETCASCYAAGRGIRLAGDEPV